jgi:hypothetical protein
MHFSAARYDIFIGTKNLKAVVHISLNNVPFFEKA